MGSASCSHNVLSSRWLRLHLGYTISFLWWFTLGSPNVMTQGVWLNSSSDETFRMYVHWMSHILGFHSYWNPIYHKLCTAFLCLAGPTSMISESVLWFPCRDCQHASSHISSTTVSMRPLGTRSRNVFAQPGPNLELLSAIAILGVGILPYLPGYKKKGSA